MKILTAVIFILTALSANAQTYTQMQWGTNKGVTPYAFGANINGTWRDLGTVSAAGAWVLSPSAINITGNISTGAVKANTSSNSLLSTSFGPDGLNWIRYSATTAPSYNRFQNTGPHSYILAATAAMINSPGSGAFGPAYAESGILASAQKDNYLTSAVDGELDTINCITTQNKKGDAACLLANVTKVRSGSGDTGGALGAEFGTYIVNPSGTTTAEVHTIPAFIESTAGVSGGGGYGEWIESWKGTNFAGVYVGNVLSSDPNTGWTYAFAAANDRTNVNWYFRVIGDKFSGVNRPGDIIMGYPATAKTLRNNSGTFEVRNTADNTNLFSISDSGAATISSSLAIGAAGTQGSVTMGGSTSGTLQIRPAAAAGTGSVLTLPGGTTDFSATGGTSQVVRQSTAGGALTVSQLAASDLSNGTTGSNAVVLATSPTLTTPVLGAATGTSLALGTTLTSGQVLTVNGSSSTNGYLRAGGNTAPTNTTSGDITGLRLNLGNSISNNAYGALAVITGNLSLAGNNFGMYFGPTITSASNITTAYGVISYPTVNMTGGAGSNTLTNNVLFSANYAGAPTGNVTNSYGYWATSSLVQAGITTSYGFECDMTSQFCFYNASTGATNIFAGKTRIGATTTPTNALDVTGDINATAGYRVNGTLAVSATAPTISSGFGTSPSVTANNGTAAFRINVGTGGTATSGVVGLPTAANGWNCFASDITTPATKHVIKQTATTPSSVTLTNYDVTIPAAAAWAASDIIIVNCMAY